MKQKFHIFTKVSAEKKSRIESGFGKSKNAAQLLGRAVLHPRIFYRHFRDQNQLLENATLDAKRSDEAANGLTIENYRLANQITLAGKLAAALKEQIGKADTKHIHGVGMYRASQVEEMKKTATELGDLLSGNKP